MSGYQQAVLDWFRERNIRAFRFAGQWVWTEDVRRSRPLAEALYWGVVVV